MQSDPIGIEGGPNTYSYGGAAPLTSVDPRGLDIVYGGGLFHSWVTIEDPDRDGNWWEYHFYPKEIPSLWDDGEVSRNKVPEPEEGDRQKTTPETDRRAKQVADRWFNNPPYYCVFYRSCHSLPRAVKKATKPKKRPGPVIPCPIPSGTVCFVAGTPVHTADGLLGIDEVQANDSVRTADSPMAIVEERSGWVAGMTGCERDLVDVEIVGEVIRSTRDHPYYTVNRGWVEARNLTAADRLLGFDGKRVGIMRVQLIHLGDPVPVYGLGGPVGNLYFVGTRGVLVHSVCSRTPGALR